MEDSLAAQTLQLRLRRVNLPSLSRWPGEEFGIGNSISARALNNVESHYVNVYLVNHTSAYFTITHQIFPRPFFDGGEVTR